MSWTTEIFVKRAREIHGDRYEYSKVDYTAALKKVSISCKEHGEFEQTPSKHLMGRGCIPCGINKCATGISIPFEDFIRRAREKHGDKFTYIQESYTMQSSKFRFICPTHEEVQMTGVCHLKSVTGCPKCRFIQTAKSKTRGIDKFIEMCKAKHGEKYEYSNIGSYQNGKSVITIGCPTHGEFQQVASKHLMGGCRKCADDLHASKSRKTLEEFVIDAQRIHGDRYEYSLVEYKNSKININIICKIHGVFTKIPSEHLNGQGCQKCKPKKHSKMCIEWLNAMKIRDNVNIQHNENIENNGEHRITNSLFHADGYCKETNTIYEFYGTYWHGDPRVYDSSRQNTQMNKTFGELYQKTLKKVEHCKKEGYSVIECWEYDWIRGIKAVKKIQRIFRKRNLTN
jgi:hypothetical protein